ncbi:MAG: DinB family protein [Candidatus Thorarchaeota archaeon]
MTDEGKKELVENLQAERARIEAMLAELTEEQMEIPGVQHDWSVKDIIAHITTWERRGTGWIKSMVDGEDPQVSFKDHAWEEMVAAHDQLNLDIYHQNRDRPLQDILSEFNQSFPLLMDQVRSLTDEDLDKQYSFRWAKDHVSGRQIVAWRFYHYRLHAKHIEAWLDSLRC